MSIFPPPQSMPPLNGVPQLSPLMDLGGGAPTSPMQMGGPQVNLQSIMQHAQMMEMQRQQQEMEAQQRQQMFEEMILDQYAPLVKLVQDRRRTIEEQWLWGLDCWNTRHRAQGFKGEWFNHYIPEGRKGLENFVTRTVQILMPESEFFEVYPAGDEMNQLGPIAESWRYYMLARMRKARSWLEQLVRCRQLYQRAISKVSMRRDESGLIWPVPRAVDPFTHYVFPETATSVEESSLIIEHNMMPMNEYQAYVDMRMAKPIDRNDLTKPEWPWHYMHRLSISGLTPPSDAPSTGPSPNQDEPIQFLSCSEMWFKFHDRWIQAWVAWNLKQGPRVVYLNTQFPTSPYRMSFARLLPGTQYTNSMMSDLEPMNRMLNDQTNMTMEGQGMAQFAPIIVDPDQVARADSLVFGPRKKWAANPEGVKILDNTTARSSLQAGYAAQAATIGMMQGYAGNQLSQGQPPRGMPRGSGAAGQMIDLSLGDMTYAARCVEDDILSPTLSDMAKMTVTLVPPQQMVLVPGSEAAAKSRFSINYLKQGEYTFRWVGSLQQQDNQQKASRLMALLGNTAKLYPSMVQDGWKLDFGTVFKKTWREGIGERGADSIIKFVGPPPPPPPPPPPVAPPPRTSISIPGALLPPEIVTHLGMEAVAQQPVPGGPGGPQGGPQGQPGPQGTGGQTITTPGSPEAQAQQDARMASEQSTATQAPGL